MWILLLSIAFGSGGGNLVAVDFGTKDQCVDAARAFAQTNPGQVKWVCAPKLRGNSDSNEKPVSGDMPPSTSLGK